VVSWLGHGIPCPPKQETRNTKQETRNKEPGTRNQEQGTRNQEPGTRNKKQMENLIITPKTKIYDLLEAYPQLEEVLIAAAPEFKKLRNPVLRKTIARITNIGQAATIGGLNVEELVNRLREKVGQGSVEQIDETGDKYVTSKPEWFDRGKVVNTIDIREMLNRGEQPVHEVLSSIKKLNDNEMLEIIAPFIPAPLLDKSMSLEYKHWLDKGDGKVFTIYFSKG